MFAQNVSATSTSRRVHRVVGSLAVDSAIARPRLAPGALQRPDKSLGGKLEADSTISSSTSCAATSWIRVDRRREAKMVRHLRDRQRRDGGWSLYEGAPSNLSATSRPTSP
jgi:hypothetical protein